MLFYKVIDVFESKDLRRAASPYTVAKLVIEIQTQI